MTRHDVRTFLPTRRATLPPRATGPAVHRASRGGALGVDSEDPNRAFVLYESAGHEDVARGTVYLEVD